MILLSFHHVLISLRLRAARLKWHKKQIYIVKNFLWKQSTYHIFSFPVTNNLNIYEDTLYGWERKSKLKLIYFIHFGG